MWLAAQMATISTAPMSAPSVITHVLSVMQHPPTHVLVVLLPTYSPIELVSRVV